MEGFKNSVAAYDRAIATRTGYGADPTDALRAQISKRVAFVEAIAVEAGLSEPERLRDWDVLYRTSNSLAAIDELIGLLQSEEELEQVLGPTGPKLSASRMHPWVWEAAARLWDGGHRRSAVQQADAAIFDGHFPAKLGLTKSTKGTDPRSLSNTFDLADAAPGTPRLRFLDLDPKSEDGKNAHEGAMYLGFACAQALRNIATHGTDEMDEDVALESLAAQSLLSRWIEAAEVQTAPS